MTATLTPTRAGELWLTATLPTIRRAIVEGQDPAAKAAKVARALFGHLPSLDILGPEQLEGDPACYQQHVLHAETSEVGVFSITALVWRPGQLTTIHDHVCWCTVGVLQGVEHETIYRLDELDGEPVMTECGETIAAAGTISHFAPPGDIHRVTNVDSGVTVSLHVYGADISVPGHQRPAGLHLTCRSGSGNHAAVHHPVTDDTGVIRTVQHTAVVPHDDIASRH